MLHGECARKYENWISNVIFNTFLEWNWLFLDNSMHYHFPHSKRHINQCLTNFISLKTFLSWFSECIDLYFITFLSSQCFFNFFISLNTLHKTSSINCSMEKKTPKNEHKKKTVHWSRDRRISRILWKQKSLKLWWIKCEFYSRTFAETFWGRTNKYCVNRVFFSLENLMLSAETIEED